LPSRLYFVTDQSEPNEINTSLESGPEEAPLAGAETTGARLDDLFQSGNEGNELNTSTSQVIQGDEEVLETSSSFISRFIKNKSDRTIQESEVASKSGFRVRRVRRLVRHIEPWVGFKNWFSFLSLCMGNVGYCFFNDLGSG